MQKITINDIKVFGHHGAYDIERKEGQYFYVSIIYNYNYDYPDDNIRNVRDYTKIIDYLLDTFNNCQFYLLEELIAYLSDALKKEFKFDYLKLSISKEIDIRDNKVAITIDKEISNG